MCVEAFWVVHMPSCCMLPRLTFVLPPASTYLTNSVMYQKTKGILNHMRQAEDAAFSVFTQREGFFSPLPL